MEYMVAGAYKCPRNEELLPLELMSSPLRNLDPRALLACFVLGLFILVWSLQLFSGFPRIFMKKFDIRQDLFLIISGFDNGNHENHAKP